MLDAVANPQALGAPVQHEHFLSRCSVVIPTKDRPESLLRAVRAVLDQSLPPAELLIIDQSASAAGRQLVTDLLEKHRDSVSLIYVHDPSIEGLTQARNEGLRRSSGDWIVYCDDDGVPDRDALLLLGRTLWSRADLGAVGGVIVSYAKPPHRTLWFRRLFNRGPFHDERQQIYWNWARYSPGQVLPTTKLNGGLMAFRRTDLVAVDGFDKQYRGASVGEDIEISLRFLNRFGPARSLALVGGAWLRHDSLGDWKDQARAAFTETVATSYLFRKSLPKTLHSLTCYLWALTGILTLALLRSLRRRDRSHLVAFFSALACVGRGYTGCSFLKADPDAASPSAAASSRWRILTGLPAVASWLMATDGSVRDRALRGGAWSVAGVAGTQLAALLKIAILGRLLAPNDFGLMGIAMIAMKWLEYFSETGLSHAMIRQPGNIRPFLDTAWTVQVLRGLGLATALFGAAPWIAEFFHNTDATWIIRVVGLTTAIRGLTNPAVIYLRRELDLRRDVLWKLTVPWAGLIAGTIVGLIYQNVWALVLSVLAGQVVSTATSYWVVAYRPRVNLNLQHAMELLHFGKWIAVFHIVVFIGMQIDSVVLGVITGTTALGYYQVARQFSLLPLTDFGTLVGGVLFPAFSRIQERADLRAPFLRALTIVSAITLPAASLLSVFAESIVLLVLGPRWMPIASALRVLASAGAASTLVTVSSSAVNAFGRPDLTVKFGALKPIMIPVLLYPLVSALGITGAALAVAAACAFELSCHLVLVSRLLHCRARDICRAFCGAALGCLPLAAMGLLHMWPLSPALEKPLQLIAAAVSVATVVNTISRHVVIPRVALFSPR